ncbi:hypothetical protein [Mycoplasmopsis gallinarum]|uniref:Uncharacterized protein n=1 Tax=Mycoplasmopsis gallinarum TaxID=29557 RepID=A0A168RIE1_9BACT|nr:hypothetical protein [Mycoplasmopsis gallinarum]OAB49013.1 hypothetical protein MGALLINA_02330 [Mycoplasmopsis gallinarum]
MASKPIIQELTKKIKKLKFKYGWRQGLFIFLNILTILIAAGMIVLNLYSIRFNIFADQTMIYFVLMAILSTVITFLVTVKSFLNIQDKKTQLTQNLLKNQETLSQIQEKKSISEEDVDNITSTF